MKSHSSAPVTVVGQYIHTMSDKGIPSYRIAYQMGDGPQPEWVGNTARLAACWNACHNLTLPPDVEPGILAELVSAAGGLIEARAKTVAAVSAMGTPDCPVGRVSELAATENRLEDQIRAILAKLTPAPVSPPKESRLPRQPLDFQRNPDK